MDIYTTTIAVSVAIYIVIGNYAGRSIKRLDDYYVAGRRVPTLIIVGTLVASVMSSTMFLGYVGILELPSFLNPVLIGGAASLVVKIAVSRRTTVSKREADNLTKLHEIPADEISANKTRTTLFAPAILIANGLIMPVLLLAYYVRPYQYATSTLSADGSLNRIAGESLFAMSWSVLYISLGIFAMKLVKNTYSPLLPETQENIK